MADSTTEGESEMGSPALSSSASAVTSTTTYGDQHPEVSQSGQSPSPAGRLSTDPARQGSSSAALKDYPHPALDVDRAHARPPLPHPELNLSSPRSLLEPHRPSGSHPLPHRPQPLHPMLPPTHPALLRPDAGPLPSHTALSQPEPPGGRSMPSPSLSVSSTMLLAT